MAGIIQRREYFPRVNPLERFHREEKFRRRYRLDKESVRQLAADFGNSDFAGRGLGSGGGISNEERVSIHTVSSGIAIFVYIDINVGIMNNILFTKAIVHMMIWFHNNCSVSSYIYFTGLFST